MNGNAPERALLQEIADALGVPISAFSVPDDVADRSSQSALAAMIDMMPMLGTAERDVIVSLAQLYSVKDLH